MHQEQLHKVGLKWAKPEVFEMAEVGQKQYACHSVYSFLSALAEIV